jgi:hypothetical protein
LPIGRIAIAARPSGTASWDRPGTAEVIAATPAEIHCHREDVLGHEGARRDQGGELAEFLAATM